MYANPYDQPMYGVAPAQPVYTTTTAVYPPQQYSQQPVPQPQAVYSPTNTDPDLERKLNPANSSTEPTRDVANHAQYDFSLLQVNSEFELQTPSFMFKVNVLIQCYLLFNAVITLMMLAHNFAEDTPQITDQLRDVAVYIPLAFFGLYYILFNNYYSEQVYYLYLKCGAVIDFPNTSSPGSWFCNLFPLSFLLLFFGYTIFMFYFFLSNGGKEISAKIYVFMSNLAIGVGMFWYRHQSIEWKFVSLSDYIQSFMGGNGTRGDIDAKSLSSAANTLQKSVLLETESPCYSGYMRNWYWRNENVSASHRVMSRVLLFGFIGAVAVGAWGMHNQNTNSSIKQKWDDVLKPCIQVCVQPKWYTAPATSSPTPSPTATPKPSTSTTSPTTTASPTTSKPSTSTSPTPTSLSTCSACALQCKEKFAIVYDYTKNCQELKNTCGEAKVGFDADCPK